MPKIIIIEDDRTMQSLLTTLLEMEGYQVVNSQQNELSACLAAIKQEKPDLAFIDINLKFGSGLDLLRSIRMDEQIKTTHVLMSSGLNYRDECNRAGADGFLLKPYMPDDLIQSIRKILNSKI
jgi:DNA-binding response OmpR family regulator